MRWRCSNCGREYKKLIKGCSECGSDDDFEQVSSSNGLIWLFLIIFVGLGLLPFLPFNIITLTGCM